MDRDALLLPFRDEGLDLCIPFLLCGEAAMQALLRQGRELDPLEPTTRLGREGKLEVLAECKGFRGRERFLERTEVVRVPIILYQADLGGVRVLRGQLL
jgi:hypothetical protein